MLKDAFSCRVGKFLGTVSLRLCVAQTECRKREGGIKKKSEKEVDRWKREKEEKRNQEIEKIEKKRKDTIPSRESRELNRAEPSAVVAEL